MNKTVFLTLIFLLLACSLPFREVEEIPPATPSPTIKALAATSTSVQGNTVGEANRTQEKQPPLTIGLHVGLDFLAEHDFARGEWVELDDWKETMTRNLDWIVSAGSRNRLELSVGRFTPSYTKYKVTVHPPPQKSLGISGVGLMLTQYIVI